MLPKHVRYQTALHPAALLCASRDVYKYTAFFCRCQYRFLKNWLLFYFLAAGFFASILLLFGLFFPSPYPWKIVFSQAD
jgi:hypothetical protein